MALTHNNT